jgi:dCTP deaminase
MMLSDRTILKMLGHDIHITPRPGDHRIQPVSVDLLLGNSFVRFPKVGPPQKTYQNGNLIRPGEFLLGTTVEKIRLPSYVAGVVVGKSTIARQGLIVEAAGLVDPGFEGAITLELFNMGVTPIVLNAGMPICQISFHLTDESVARPYGSPGLDSHYQNQEGATPAHD